MKYQRMFKKKKTFKNHTPKSKILRNKPDKGGERCTG